MFDFIGYIVESIIYINTTINNDSEYINIIGQMKNVEIISKVIFVCHSVKHMTTNNVLNVF